MSAQPKLMPDVEGLARQVDPLSRRGFFLTASAAAATGYTLADGEPGRVGFDGIGADLSATFAERPIRFYLTPQGRQSQRLILRKLPSSRSMVTVLQPPRILSREYRQS
jgi:hypothetical protein